MIILQTYYDMQQYKFWTTLDTVYGEYIEKKDGILANQSSS